MKTAVIRQRVADFLLRHAPFDSLEEADLLVLAGSGKVKFCESEEFIYWQGDAKGPFVWTIQQGRVELLEKGPGGDRLRDVLGEGDLLGLERFEGDGRCRYSARTASDVILYGVAAPLMESMVARYPALRRFLAAHFSVSGALGYGRTSWLESPAPPPDFLRARLASGASHTDDPNLPKISGPVDTRRAVREMLSARAESLALVDGDNVAQGVLTARDIAMFSGHDPVGVVQGIRNASSEAELKPLLGLAARMVREGVAQPHDIEDCCLIGDEVLAALADACLRLAEEEVRAQGVAAADVPYCWVMFNSAARGDMPAWELPRLAAIYDDSGTGVAPNDRIYFNALADTATRFLQAAGLSGHTLEWPEGVQPGMPVSEWKRFYAETIRNPLAYDLYARRAFFDLRLLGGEASILEQLAAHIESELSECAGTIALLAIDTMANVPPLTFFEGLAISIDGAKSDTFDIGQAVVAPLSNAARVFSLSRRRLAPVNTLARLETATSDFPEGAEALRLAADAFRVGVYYQTLAGSPHIDCAMLGKFDQKLLKTTFASIERFLEFTVNTMVPVE